MTIYRMEYDDHTYPLIDIGTQDDWLDESGKKISYAPNVSKQHFWGMAKGKYYIESDYFNVPDLNLYPCPDICKWDLTGRFLGGDGFALSEKAKNKIGSTLEGKGEFLPVIVEDTRPEMIENTQFVKAEETGYIKVKDTQFYCFNLLTTTEAIDPFNSRKEENIVKALAFIEHEVKDLLVFYTPYDDYEQLYCTDKFKNLIENSGLTCGWTFHEDLREAQMFGDDVVEQ